MTDNAIGPGPNGAARAALASLIDLHGPALLHEPDRLRRQLDGALPDAPREVALILSSMDQEVPHALLAAHSDDQLRTLFPQLVDRLVRKTGIEQGAATWAVRTWAHALAVAVEERDAVRPDGMRRALDRSTGDAGPRSAGDTPESDAAAETRMLEEREASRRSSTAEVLGFGSRPVRLKAPSTVRPTGPLVSPPPAAETLVAFDASRERVADVADDDVPVASSAADAEAPARPTALAGDALHEVPAVVVPASVPEPVDVVEPVEMVEAVEPVAVVGAVAAVAAPVELPSAPSPSPRDEPLPIVETASSAETVAPAPIEPGIATPIAPPVIRVDPAAPPLPADPGDPPPLPFAPQRRSSSRTFALAAAIAAAVIVIGATLWPAPQPRSAPDPKPTASATTTPRPSTPPTTLAAAGAAPAVTTPAVTTPAPASPAPADKPGEPAIASTQPAAPSDTTSEPRPSEPRPSTPERVVPPTRDVAPPASAEVVAPAVIPSTPAASKAAPLVVKKPDAPPVRQVAVATATPKPVKAAEAHKPTPAPAACTRSTCGSVVSVRAIDDAAARDYEVIVRLDDRTIRAVRMPARWSPGARVRVVGSRFEPVGDR